MNEHPVRMHDHSSVASSLGQCDQAHWNCRWQLDKYEAGIDDVRSGRVQPFETVVVDGNLLTYGGADLLWLGLRDGLSTSSTGAANGKFSNGNASIGVGNSTTAAAATQTDLVASSSRKYRKGMEATFPTHTTGTTAAAQSQLVFKATFSTAQANWAWAEWAIFNSTAQTGGRMLNRKVQALGTKTTSATWSVTATLTLS